MKKDFNGIDKNTIEAARNGDTEAVMSKLSADDRKKIEDVLADRDKLKKILSSDAAQNLLKFLDGKQNG